ncbi:MAG: acyl-CoA dehydrogenase family protein [Halioglobus sp.]|nr:acyl-CoA dehydrogenase family protein [Halioglobus sp.]
MGDAETFRAETRAWLEENCPASMRTPMRTDDDVCWGGRECEFQSEDQRLWLERMAERGWTVPEWPRQYGGGGLDAEQAGILKQEMASLGCRQPLASLGIIMLAPAMFKFASEEQKLEHLPGIARGEIRWCQGYSEPGAGSDLAGLQTSAADNGDHYVVNGAKIWTSYGHKSDWIFCLVRTDPDAPKRDGISFLLFDMASEGVSTSPIRLISGASPFCQTFFDDVRVPKGNIVGEVNKGWTVAKYLLQHERNMAAALGSRRSGKKKTLQEIGLEALGRDDGGALADPVLRTKLARFQVREQAFTLTMQRIGDEMKQGGDPGPTSSVLKYYGSETNKQRRELWLALAGMDSLGWEGEEFEDGLVARSWLRSKANSIEGGTSEIQLNIIAKRVLGLPTSD